MGVLADSRRIARWRSSTRLVDDEPRATGSPLTTSRRSFEPVTDAHLERLKDLALVRDAELRRKRPDWCSDRIAICLGQGAARHRVHGDRGVKDLDVWIFYALGPGQGSDGFPFNRANAHVDFGPSTHGVQSWSAEERSDPRLARRIRAWAHFLGRRVDIMARGIAYESNPRDAVVAWVHAGSSRHGSSGWHLSRAPVVAIDPNLGKVWWAGPRDDEPGVEKGAYS